MNKQYAKNCVCPTHISMSSQYRHYICTEQKHHAHNTTYNLDYSHNAAFLNLKREVMTQTRVVTQKLQCEMMLQTYCPQGDRVLNIFSSQSHWIFLQCSGTPVYFLVSQIDP